MDIRNATKWIAFKVSGNKEDIFELIESLAMNGYTYDCTWNDYGDAVIFVAELEAERFSNEVQLKPVSVEAI